eukprot:TRINITY_DN2543_c0_g2_i2.p1 TRINITY_DN2543_c0_g2~~TRINITY_DN2543_c0_g2_i2.p1  ORF type:complete len:281 (-),score=42.12 TRINITY_DN2543_c0_g2_i2:117-959(-)
MEFLYLTTGFLGEKARETQAEMYYVNLALFILFILAEVWCLISTIKLFSVRAALHGVSVLALYICLHMMLSLRIFYCLGIFAFSYTRPQVGYIENFSILAKDLFVAILSWRLMEIVSSLDESRKCIDRVIKFLLAIIILHTLVFLVLYVLWVVGKLSVSTLGTYCTSTEILFAIIYVYACVETMRFWRNSNIESGLTGYLKWLFGVMIYMVLVLIIRVIANVLEASKTDMRMNGYAYYKMMLYILVEFVPCVIMSICLYMMTKDFEHQSESITEKYSDEF